MWRPTPDARVRTLNVAAGGSGRLFIGGDFNSVSATPGTSRLAAVALAAPGAVSTGFKAAPTNNGSRAPVYDVISDASRVYVGVAGSGGACAALDASTGALLWSDHTNGNLQAVRLSGGLLYCGGHFSGTASFAGVNRQKLAAVDPATGAVTSFAPNINSSQGVWTLASAAHELPAFFGLFLTTLGAVGGVGASGGGDGRGVHRPVRRGVVADPVDGRRGLRLAKP